MKQHGKMVAGTALGVAVAAAFAAGCTTTCALMTNVNQTLYGPPPDDVILRPEDEDDNQTSASQTYDPAEDTFDPSENEPVEVYGPPEWSDNELLND